MTSVPRAIEDAGSRLGASFDLALANCADDRSSCRWKTRNGIQLLALSWTGVNTYAIEASWSNHSAESTGESAPAFRGLCATAIAAARPGWSKQRILALISKVALLRPTKKDGDVEVKADGLLIYGSRTVPVKPDFPAEAFMQCGVRADVDK